MEILKIKYKRNTHDNNDRYLFAHLDYSTRKKMEDGAPNGYIHLLSPHKYMSIEEIFNEAKTYNGQFNENAYNPECDDILTEMNYLVSIGMVVEK